MKRISYEELVAVVGGDRELITILLREQVIASAESFEIRDVDRVLAARTLVRELEIDAGAVGLILRLREELAAARRELARLKRGSSR